MEDLCREGTYLFVIIDILFWTVLYYGGCPAHCRMFSIILVPTHQLPAPPASPFKSIRNLSRLPSVSWVEGHWGPLFRWLDQASLKRLVSFPQWKGERIGASCRGLAEGEWFPALIRNQNWLRSWYRQLQTWPLANDLFVFEFTYL